jgi:hypothetical protein
MHTLLEVNQSGWDLSRKRRPRIVKHYYSKLERISIPYGNNLTASFI